MTSKYLHFGRDDAAAQDHVKYLRLSKHLFKLSFKFLKVFGKKATEINKNKYFNQNYFQWETFQSKLSS